MRKRRFRRSPLAVLLSLCLLSIGVATPFGIARAAGEMTFRTVRVGAPEICGGTCPDVIAATGQITQSTPTEFLEFIQQNYDRRNLHAVVFLNSPGGRVLASMEFGTLLRKIGAAAVVAGVYPDGSGGSVMTNGQCFSACVYALMGARKRVIPPSSQVGIHRMFVYEDSLDASGTTYLRRRKFDNGDMREFLMGYSAEMGVSPGLIAAAEHIPSETLHILTRSEIKRWHLGVPKL